MARLATHGQRGAALVVSLLFLVVLTAIGITGMKVTTLEEKVTGNSRDRSVAFQAAESALRAGEVNLAAGAAPSFNCLGGMYRAEDFNCDNVRDPGPLWERVNWASPFEVTPFNGNLAGVAAQPASIIEELPAEIPLQAGDPPRS